MSRKSKPTPKPEQDEKGRFVPGNSGNGGRPKGSRNKLGEAFLADMLADWEENGSDAIKRARSEKPEVYLKVVASLLPKELNVTVDPLDEMTDEQLIKRMRQLDSIIAPFLAGRAGEDNGEASPATTR